MSNCSNNVACSLKSSIFSVRNSIAKMHFRTFWSNATHSPDSPVNVLIETRSLHQNGTIVDNLQNAKKNHFYPCHIDSLQNINGIIPH